MYKRLFPKSKLIDPTHIEGCKLWLDASVGGNVKSGNSAQFTAANSEYLSIADNAALSMGDIDFTIAGWFYFDSFPSAGNNMALVGKWGLGDNEYVIHLNNAAGVITLRFVTRNTANTVSTSAISSVTPSTATWYFVAVYHNATTNLIGISINDGAFVTTATTGGVRDAANTFEIGRFDATYFLDGRAHDVIIAKQIYTAAEITFLYNSGNGRPFVNLGIA